MLRLWVKAHTSLVPAVRTHLADRKAAGMLEYALVALISVAVFGVILLFFPDFIQTLFDDLKKSITGK